MQTNFSIVAYTTTALHVKMLSLFVDTGSFVFLPNMVMGGITRESVKGALAKGIKAKQIVDFLKINAHPCLRGEDLLVPENVEVRAGRGVKRRACSSNDFDEALSQELGFPYRTSFLSNHRNNPRRNPNPFLHRIRFAHLRTKFFYGVGSFGG